MIKPEPAGFDPTCHLCDIDRHICRGCGANVPHGTIACNECNKPDHVDLDGTTAAWIEAARAANAGIARYTEIRDRAYEVIKERLGDATEGRFNGRPVVSWAWSKPGQRLDRKKLEGDFGADVIAAYLVDNTPARPFRLLEES